MKKQIALIDTGAANLHSIYKAFKYLGANIEVTNDLNKIKKSDSIVFPGVGAFGSVMKAIQANNLEEIIIEEAKSKKPFLGICVGMQVLFEESEENPDVKGLGVFKGKVVKFKKARKVPHIGWNVLKGTGPGQARACPLLYFVHSYYPVPQDKNIIYAETEYDGEIFTSIIKKDNLLAVQFHPEKSGEAGLSLLKDFIYL